MHIKPLTKEQYKKLTIVVRKEFKNGMPKAQIQRNYGVSFDWVKKKVHGIIPRKRLTKFDKYKLRIVRLYNSGRDMLEISKKLKLRYNFIKFALTKCHKVDGIKRHFHPTSEEKIQKIITLYESGIGCKRISQQVGLNKTSVLRCLHGRTTIRKCSDYRRPLDVVRMMLNYRLNTCKKHYLGCELDMDFLVSLYQKQNGKCALTGVPLKAVTRTHYSISIDRINNAKGYQKDNVRLVCKFVNLARHDLTDGEFHDFMGDLIKFYRCIRPNRLLTNQGSSSHSLTQ